MKITVCVGSSCHVKGSHEVVARLEQLITEHQLKDQVEMTGTFCIGRCQEGVRAGGRRVLLRQPRHDRCFL